MKLIKFMRLMGGALVPYSLGILLMTVSSKIFVVIKSFLIKDVFDLIEYGGSLKLVVIKSLSAGCVCLAVYTVTSYMYKAESKRAHMHLKQLVFNKIMHMPISSFEEDKSGGIISRFFYDTNKASDIYTAKLRRFSAPLLSIAVYAVPMAVLNLPLTLCLAAANLLSVLLNAYFSKKIRIVRTELSQKNALMTQQINNIISGIAAVKIFGLGGIFADDYKKLNNEYFDCEKKESHINSGISAAVTFFDFICSIVFLCVGIVFVSKGIASVSALAAVYAMYGDFSSQFSLVCRYFPDLVGCLVSADRIFEILDTEDESISNGETAAVTAESNAAVEFYGVSFAYTNRQALNNFSMKIDKGEKIAVIGASGGGKSTAAKLLMGFYKPQKGKILLNGCDISGMDLYNLRSKISYVPQEPYIFDVSIEDNIKFGCPNASHDDVVKAAKAAGAHDFIISKPDGYNTKAGERGSRLSGGERQRIAAARALIKKAPVLLLDEATSALDTNTEQTVLKAVREYDGTVVMTAHREAVVKAMDRAVKV